MTEIIVIAQTEVLRYDLVLRVEKLFLYLSIFM